MAGLTPYAEGKALDLLLRGTAYTPPAAVYIGLFATAPADDGSGGVEVVGTGYARIAISFGAYASRQIASSNTVNWNPGSAWGAVPALGIFDALTGGNLLAHGGIGPVPNIVGGSAFAFAVGQVVVTFTKLGPYLAQQVAELLFKATAKSQLPTLTAKLFTVAPSDDGAGGTEVSASGYAAQTVSYAAYNATTKRSNLAADVAFTTSAPASWGSPPAFGLFSGANFLGQGAITPLPTIGVGAPFSLAAANTLIGFLD